jgi:membrane-associated phospholipid phosphatase
MKCSTVVLLVGLSMARGASAQTSIGSPTDWPSLIPDAAPETSTAPQAAATSKTKAFQPAEPSLFKAIPHDFKNFFSADTGRILGAFAIAGLAARPADKSSVEESGEGLSSGVANFGNVGGSLYVQLGTGLATYFVGHATGKPQLASFGVDVIRAQVLTQVFVQGTKFAVQRQRPDASDSMSFPSGHTASAFATATVVQQHFGWKAGVPAYAFAGFVGASRMASGKHYLTDVLVGAGFGIAAGRTVTVHLGAERFALGVAPTQGGAMVSFTKQ